MINKFNQVLKEYIKSKKITVNNLNEFKSESNNDINLILNEIQKNQQIKIKIFYKKIISQNIIQSNSEIRDLLKILKDYNIVFDEELISILLNHLIDVKFERYEKLKTLYNFTKINSDLIIKIFIDAKINWFFEYDFINNYDNTQIVKIFVKLILNDMELAIDNAIQNYSNFNAEIGKKIIGMSTTDNNSLKLIKKYYMIYKNIEVYRNLSTKYENMGLALYEYANNSNYDSNKQMKINKIIKEQNIFANRQFIIDEHEKISKEMEQEYSLAIKVLMLLSSSQVINKNIISHEKSIKLISEFSKNLQFSELVLMISVLISLILLLDNDELIFHKTLRLCQVYKSLLPKTLDQEFEYANRYKVGKLLFTSLYVSKDKKQIENIIARIESSRELLKMIVTL